MKRMMAVFAVLTALAPVASAAEVSRFKANGASADLYFEQNGVYTSLSVYQGDQNQSYLSYYQSQCAYTDVSFTCSGKNLYGALSNRDFSLQGKNKATLSTNGSGLSGTSFTYTCTYDTYDCNFQETPISGGTFQVTWNKSSEYSSHNTGTSQSEYFNFRYRSSGSYSSTSAKASGNVLGVSLSNVSGSIGVSKSRSITIEKLN